MNQFQLVPAAIPAWEKKPSTALIVFMLVIAGCVGYRVWRRRRFGALGDVRSPTSTSTEVRSPTSTSTEVRSPTSTSTEVRSPTSTSTSTEADTAGNITVTGGAGDGATTTVTIHGMGTDYRSRDHKKPTRFPVRATDVPLNQPETWRPRATDRPQDEPETWRPRATDKVRNERSTRRPRATDKPRRAARKGN